MFGPILTLPPRRAPLPLVDIRLAAREFAVALKESIVEWASLCYQNVKRSDQSKGKQFDDAALDEAIPDQALWDAKCLLHAKNSPAWVYFVELYNFGGEDEKRPELFIVLQMHKIAYLLRRRAFRQKARFLSLYLHQKVDSVPLKIVLMWEGLMQHQTRITNRRVENLVNMREKLLPLLAHSIIHGFLGSQDNVDGEKRVARLSKRIFPVATPPFPPSPANPAPALIQSPPNFGPQLDPAEGVRVGTTNGDARNGTSFSFAPLEVGGIHTMLLSSGNLWSSKIDADALVSAFSNLGNSLIYTPAVIDNMHTVGVYDVGDRDGVIDANIGVDGQLTTKGVGWFNANGNRSLDCQSCGVASLHTDSFSEVALAISWWAHARAAALELPRYKHFGERSKYLMLVCFDHQEIPIAAKLKQVDQLLNADAGVFHEFMFITELWHAVKCCLDHFLSPARSKVSRSWT